jgi:hypothetical protein
VLAPRRQLLADQLRALRILIVGALYQPAATDET